MNTLRFATSFLQPRMYATLLRTKRLATLISKRDLLRCGPWCPAVRRGRNRYRLGRTTVALSSRYSRSNLADGRSA
jgi:hypothetical protein